MLKQLGQVRAERAAPLDKLEELQRAEDAAIQEEVNRHLAMAAIDLMRRPEWRARHYISELDELQIALGGRLRWQATIRLLLSAVWLEQDGGVTVEGPLPLDVATVSPPS